MFTIRIEGATARVHTEPKTDVYGTAREKARYMAKEIAWYSSKRVTLYGPLGMDRGRKLADFIRRGASVCVRDFSP